MTAYTSLLIENLPVAKGTIGRIVFTRSSFTVTDGGLVLPLIGNVAAVPSGIAHQMVTVNLSGCDCAPLDAQGFVDEMTMQSWRYVGSSLIGPGITPKIVTSQGLVPLAEAIPRIRAVV